MTQIIIMTTIHGGYSKFCCWCFFFNEFLSNFSWPIILVASFYIFYSVLSEVFFLKSMIIGKYVCGCGCALVLFFFGKNSLSECDGNEMVTRTPDIKLWNDIIADLCHTRTLQCKSIDWSWHKNERISYRQTVLLCMSPSLSLSFFLSRSIAFDLAQIVRSKNIVNIRIVPKIHCLELITNENKQWKKNSSHSPLVLSFVFSVSVQESGQ